ncbi:MAG: hypothetical protein HY850_03130 [Betaproteobacteria bacterium]|nr:hypothetical protein [Betaproteobacteria bacterium]
MELNSLTSAAFAALAGKAVTVQAAQGELALEVFDVKEKAMAQGPNAKRVPFSVLLRGPESPCLIDGCYGLHVDGETPWQLEAVFLTRIVPPASSDGSGAYYQLAFT